MATLITTFVFVFSWTAGSLALQCPSCLHVDYVKGSVQVASMTVFVNNSQNSLCKSDPNAVPTTTCPDTGYECGFLDEEIDVFAHLVGQVSLHFYYRDCVKKPLLSDPFLGCLETHIEETMFAMLWDQVPDSVISQQPGGSCYCRRIEGCKTYKGNNTSSVTTCPDGWIRIFGKCYEWWIIVVIVADILIVLILAALIACCLCRRCPLYYRRSEYRDHKLIGRHRRHSAPDPGYYIGPGVADDPVERANIAMPGFGAPVAMDPDMMPITPRANVALAGVTGFAQPGIYSSRYYGNDDDDQRSASTERFTWRTTPRRYRTVYDVQGYYPDDDDNYY